MPTVSYRCFDGWLPLQTNKNQNTHTPRYPYFQKKKKFSAGQQNTFASHHQWYRLLLLRELRVLFTTREERNNFHVLDLRPASPSTRCYPSTRRRGSVAVRRVARFVISLRHFRGTSAYCYYCSDGECWTTPLIIIIVVAVVLGIRRRRRSVGSSGHPSRRTCGSRFFGSAGVPRHRHRARRRDFIHWSRHLCAVVYDTQR